MTQKFIAIAAKGKEFLYNKRSMIAVPTKSAQRIADMLNAVNYKLKDGQTWWVYDNDWYTNDYIESEIKRCGKGNLKVYRYEG
jgi:hypothetical protein